MESKQLCERIIQILDDNKAENITAIETSELTIVSDYFIVTNGTSSTHVRSLADLLEDTLDKEGVKVNHIEGRATGWILLDYGAVVVHIFDRESREYYNLERLWTDAQIVDITHLIKEN